jgi:hypothetical protein
MIVNNLKYQNKVESAPARRYRTNVQPQNGQGTASSGYGANNTIIINIPTRNNTALIPSESVLKFSGTYTPSATAVVQSLESCGHHGWINRLRVFHGSNLLQDIQEYHQLAKILYDFQMPNDSVAGRYSVTSGTTNEFTGGLLTATSGTVANGDALVVKPVNRGRNFVSGTVAGSSSAVTFDATINLISLVGALAGGKYLPLWQMTSAPLRVELVLQDSINKVMCFNAGTPTNGAFNLYNVEYIAEFLELPDSAINAIEAGSSNPLQMVIPDWRAYTYSQQLTQNVTTQISMPIPAKFSSLKSIVVNQKLTTGAVQYYPSSSGKMGLQSYQFRIGSEVLPSSAPNNTADFFNEAGKCFGSVADINYQPSVDIDAYNFDAPVAITTYNHGQTFNSGSFLVGIDLESYQNSDKSTIFAGMNTNTSDIFYQPTHLYTGTNTQCYYCAFANFDSVLVCENGVAYVRF